MFEPVVNGICRRLSNSGKDFFFFFLVLVVCCVKQAEQLVSAKLWVFLEGERL